MNTKSDSTRATIRGAEARIRENHAGKGALKPMDPPIQEPAAASRAKADLHAAAERALKR